MPHPANTNFYEKLHKFLFPTAAEAIGNIFVIAFLVGAFNAMFKAGLRFVAMKLGIENVQKTQESWAWIGQRLYMSLERMGADRVAFYTVSNGKPYFDQIEWADTKLKIAISELRKVVDSIDPADFFLGENYKILSHNTNKIANRGVNRLPDELDIQRFKNLLYQVVETDSVGEYFTPDLPESTYLRKLFLEYGIEGYIILTIESHDKTRLYGFLIYTYSDVKLMPNNLKTRMAEHLADVRTIITNEYKAILEMSIMKKVKRFINMLKPSFVPPDKLLPEIKIRKDSDNVYRLEGNFSLGNIQYTSDKIMEKIEKCNEPIIIIVKRDCRIDSSGIGELFKLAQIHKIKFNGVRIRIEGLSDMQTKVFNMAKLNQFLEY